MAGVCKPAACRHADGCSRPARTAASTCGPRPPHRHRDSLCSRRCVRSTRPVRAGGSTVDAANADDAGAWVAAWRARHEPSRAQLWKMCIKLPMYSVAVAPMVVAAALAYFATGTFAGSICKDLVLGGILVIAWLNISNDAFDSLTGVDSAAYKPESLANLTGLSAPVLVAASLAALLLGVKLLMAPIAACGSRLPGQLFLAAIACGYAYQGPPFRLGYLGLGEVLCFVAFGPLAVAAAFLCHALPYVAAPSAAAYLQSTLHLWAPAAAVVGLTTSSILFCSHFHQIAGDTAAGKRSPLTRLGTRRGTQVLLAVSVVTHLIAFLSLSLTPDLSALAPLGILAVPAAVGMNSFAFENHRVPRLIKPLKLKAIRWHMAVAAALFLAYVTSGVSLYGAESLA